MEHNLPTNFTNLLLALQYKKTYQRALSMARQQFYIKQINIEDLTPFKVLDLYRTIIKKFYMNRTQITQGSWFQNQLRVYLWLLIGYVFIHKKTIHQMQNDDWNYFCPIFRQRQPISFEFQALSLNPPPKSSKWSVKEIEILHEIIKQKKFKNKWNSIARQLFIRSDKEFYRTPKQCRQRWLNYLDPAKKKTGWDKTEDLILLKTIQHEGKKWSTVVRILNGTRTEHMVKNRFKSMIAIEMKKKSSLKEDEIISKLIMELQKELFNSRDLSQSGVSTLLKIQYSDNSTENQTRKDQGGQKIAVNYSENMHGYANVAIAQNVPNFFLLSPIPYNSPLSDPYRLNSKYETKACMQKQLPDDNEFLISRQQIENYIMFEEKQKLSLMKDEDIQEKAGQMSSLNDHMSKGEKINYFSEDFHECFP